MAQAIVEAPKKYLARYVMYEELPQHKKSGVHECIFKTPSGKWWIRSWSDAPGVRDVWNQVEASAAARWLRHHGHHAFARRVKAQ